MPELSQELVARLSPFTETWAVEDVAPIRNGVVRTRQASSEINKTGVHAASFQTNRETRSDRIEALNSAVCISQIGELLESGSSGW